MAKRKNKKNKIFINIIIALVTLAIIAYLMYTLIKLAISPTNIFVVKTGDIFSNESTIGYIIREETVIKGTNYQNGIVQIKAEGEKVSKGTPVFRYYTSNESDLTNKIEELNLKIQEALAGQTNLFSSDIKAIENQIEIKIEGLKTENNIQQIEEYKKDIDTYITKKARIAGSLSNAGSYINELINQKVNYENQLYSNSEYIKANTSGIISYRVDGLEEVLNPNDFSNLNAKFLESLNLKTGQIVSTSNEMGKIVNNFESYIVCIMNSEEAKNAEIGDKVTLKLSSTQNEITANIEQIIEDNNNVLLIFKIYNSVEETIDCRKISINVIWNKESGLKIPKSAILYDNGLSYVIKNSAGYKSKILIKILNENKNYCLVDNYETKDLKELGYSTSEISSLKKINMYDEILLNPTLEDIT